VQVQNGCDHRCTFCIIPYGRGNSRSVPAGEVVEQIKRLSRPGFNEVVLTGVDLTSYGAPTCRARRAGRSWCAHPEAGAGPAALRLSSHRRIEADESCSLAIATRGAPDAASAPVACRRATT
jgi:threonylcarbamoyladenosine tRNA methylthiotransferase MtaB